MSTVAFADLVRLIDINGLLGEKELAPLKDNLDKSIDPKKLLFKLLEANKITKWQAKQLILGNEKLKIGNLILTEEIGQTSIGGLYHARQIGLDRPVMLLLLNEQYHSDPRLLEEFGKRIGHFSGIVSPAMVRPLEVKKDEDEIVVVMDDYQGEDLFQYIKDKGPLSKHECVRIVNELTGVLAEMHATGELHGDLTPSSIIINREGNAKLLCFNPVQIDDVAIAEHQEYFASPNVNSAPEDPANDLYSLGRIGLFMLTGDFPEDEQSAGQKSPLVSLFFRMASTDKKTRIDRPQRVAALLDRWLEINAETPEAIVVEDKPDGLGLSSEDYQSDGGNAGVLNFGADFAQSRVQERLQKRKSKAAAQPAGAKAKSGEHASVTAEAESAEHQVADKKFPLGLVLGIAGGVGAAVLLFGGGLIALWVFVLAPKSDVQIAEADQQAATSDVEPEAKKDAGETPAEVAAEKKDEPVRSDLPDSPVAPTDDKKTDESGKTADDGKGNAGKDDSPAPVKPAGDGDDTAKTDDSKKEEGGKTDPVLNTPVNPEVAVTPEPVKPEPEKPAIDPLAEVPAVLAIPELGTPKTPGEDFDQPKVLAKITLHPAEFFMIDLHGGKKAYKDETSFDLKEAPGAVGERKWDIRFTPNTKVESKFDVIADMKIENDQLIFQWRKEALPIVGAGCFRNCLLALKTGTSIKPVALRDPVAIPPLVLDEKTLGGKTEAKVDDLPELDALFVEIMMPAENFPTHKFVGGKSTISAVKGETGVLFGELTHEYLAFGIQSRGRGKIMVSLESQLQSADGTGVKFPGRKKMEESIEPNTLQEKAFAEELTRLKALTATKEITNQISIGQLALNRLKENNVRTNAFMAVLGQLEKREIPVRVYFQAGEYQVNLATPDGKPLPAANQK